MKNKSVITGAKSEDAGFVLNSEGNSSPANPNSEERLLHPPKSREARIAVPTFDGLQMVNVEDIVKCIAHEKYTEIILISGSRFMVSRNLKEYEDMLTAFNFFRIHHSCLVNLRHLKKYVRGEGGYVLMADGHI